MTSNPQRDAAYWRQKAEEARLMAASMNVLGGREALLEIADKYMRMAALAERKAPPAEDDPGSDQR